MDEMYTDTIAQRGLAMTALAAAVDTTDDEGARLLLLEFMRRTTLSIVIKTAEIVPFPTVVNKD